MPRCNAASGHGISGWLAAIILASCECGLFSHPNIPRPTATGLHKQQEACRVRPKKTEAQANVALQAGATQNVMLPPNSLPPSASALE
jgi:hypothetical protein